MKTIFCCVFRQKNVKSLQWNDEIWTMQPQQSQKINGKTRESHCRKWFSFDSFICWFKTISIFGCYFQPIAFEIHNSCHFGFILPVFSMSRLLFSNKSKYFTIIFETESETLSTKTNRNIILVVSFDCRRNSGMKNDDDIIDIIMVSSEK